LTLQQSLRSSRRLARPHALSHCAAWRREQAAGEAQLRVPTVSDRPRAQSPSVSLTLSRVREVQGLSLREAAAACFMGTTQFKLQCRKLGVARWCGPRHCPRPCLTRNARPHRQVKSLQSLLASCRALSRRDATADAKLSLDAWLVELERLQARNPRARPSLAAHAPPPAAEDDGGRAGRPAFVRGEDQGVDDQAAQHGEAQAGQGILAPGLRPPAAALPLRLSPPLQRTQHHNTQHRLLAVRLHTQARTPAARAATIWMVVGFADAGWLFGLIIMYITHKYTTHSCSHWASRGETSSLDSL